MIRGQRRGFARAAVAAVLALTALAGTAQANIWNRPFRYHHLAKGQEFNFIDFSVSTPAGHFGGFDSFPQPLNGSVVRYVDPGLYTAGVTACFEYTFSAINGTPTRDITLWVNTASESSPSWTKVSDDVEGGYPRFRVWLGANWGDTVKNALRISAWSAANNDAQFFIKRIELAYSQATCESTGAVVRLDNGVTIVRTSN